MKMFLSLITIVFLSFTAFAGNITGYQGNMNPSVSVTIANSAQESSLINMSGFSLVGIKTPSALTGTAITFLSCDSAGANCIPIKTSTSGTALSYTVTTSSFYAIEPKDFYGVQYLKLKSGTTEGGARTLVCSLKGI